MSSDRELEEHIFELLTELETLPLSELLTKEAIEEAFRQ